MPATHSLQNPRYRGIFPVVPTTFHEDGTPVSYTHLTLPTNREV